LKGQRWFFSICHSGLWQMWTCHGECGTEALMKLEKHAQIKFTLG
jgi:hypothetical protein